MAVPCPVVEWPRSLMERGPAEDPTILLMGRARIAGTPVLLLALRVRPELRRTPDYKPDVPRTAYVSSTLETLLDELEYMTEEVGLLTGAAETSLVQLPTGAYAVWLLPAAQHAEAGMP